MQVFRHNMFMKYIEKLYQMFIVYRKIAPLLVMTWKNWEICIRVLFKSIISI